MGSVRVAIIGVGNCASALVQGVHYYKNAPDEGFIPGLMQPRLAGYHVGDIEFSAAFDVDANKVGHDLSEAIWSKPNNTVRFSDVPHLGVPVQRGMTHDGLGHYLSQVITKAPGSTVDVGDDVKSQVGATIVHRVLTKLFMDRGVRLEHTSQLNVGGNTDFLNMLERSRLASKKISKTDAVRSQLAHEMEAEDIHIGPSDYVPWLNDRKWAHIRLEGRSFGDQPINLELKLEVWDSPNSAGVVIDAIRSCKIAMDRGIKGALLAPSAYLMKSPPEQWSDETAHERLERFIDGGV